MSQNKATATRIGTLLAVACSRCGAQFMRPVSKINQAAKLKEKMFCSKDCLRLANQEKYLRHGMSAAREYHIWRTMKSRCSNPKSTNYPDYGGRGISVCDRWMDFANFFADMGNCPTGMSIDRINVNGNYEPGNCRWATQKEQCRNKRGNVIIEYRGSKMCLQEVAELTGLSPNAVRHRVINGIHMDRPKRGKNKNAESNGPDAGLKGGGK